MPMTYSESAKGVMIDRERVIKELVNHGHMPGSLEWKMICQELWQTNFVPDEVNIDAHKLLEALGY
jgi:hypothetical protein